MNNKLPFLFIFAILLVGLASAGITYEENNQTYTVDTWVPSWLGGLGTSTIKLESNTDYCLIDCGFHLSGYNEKPVSLIDDIKFIDKKGKDASSGIKSISFELGTYQEVEVDDYENPIYGNEVCNEVSINETNSTEPYCYTPIESYEKKTITDLVWVPYNGEKVDGYFELKASAKKEKISVDWIVTYRGKDLSEWAWWNGDWEYKREVTITENSGSSLSNYSTLIYVPYSANMKTDFSDLRFVDSAETTELGYWIENKTDSNFAYVWVKVPNLTASINSTIYMYYGNSGASSESNLVGMTLSYPPLEWDYNTSYSVSAQSTDPHAVQEKDGLYYLLDANANKVFEYSPSFAYTGNSWTINIKSASSRGIEWDGTNWWLASDGQYDDFVYKYNSDWTYTGFKFDVSAQGQTVPGTIGSDGNYLYVGGFGASTMIKYNYDGTYTGTTYNLPARLWGFAYIDGFYYLNLEGTVYKYYPNITTYIDSWNLGTQDTNMFGIDFTNKYWISSGRQNDKIYLYKARASVEPTYTIGEEQQNRGVVLIDYITPPTLANNSIWNQTYIPVKVNVTYTNSSLVNITYSLYNSTGLYQELTFTNETYEINFTNCLCDNYQYNVTIYANESITDTIITDSTTTRYLEIDARPPVINVTSPVTTYDYLYPNQTLDLNYSVVDEAGHLDSCWYSYNETNTTLNCSENTTFNYIPNINNLTLYANDTFGNVGSKVVNWGYNVLENSITYNPQTIEGSYETYELNITKIPSVSITSAVLHYDGQSANSQLFVSGNNVRIVSNLFINSVGTDTNNTFYWTLTLSDSTMINTTSSIQNVKNILIGNCTAYSNPLLTLFLKDEGDKSLINGTIQTDLKILNNLNFGEAYEFNSSSTNVNTLNLCSSINLTNTTFLLDAEIRYLRENYSTEFYHIQKAALNLYPKNISLYLLKGEDTTKFTVVYRNQQLIGMEGAIIQLQRKYVNEGIYEIVEAPLTSSDSKAIVHIDTNTNKYQITVVKDGEVLGVFENLAFICQSELTGECVLNLFETITAPQLPTLTELRDFSYYITTNDTAKEITLTYSVPSGTPADVKVTLFQSGLVGTSLNCNETIISSAGSITCEYNKSIQDSTLDFKVYKSDSLIAQKGYVVSDSILEDFGGINYFILILFVISLAFMAISSPEWIIINAVIALLIGGATFLIRGMDFVVGIGGLVWLVVAAIILISKISKQEDQ